MAQRPAITRRARVATQLLVVVLWACCGSARCDEVLEQRVKAAFLFNFAKFVSWPPDKLGAPEQPIVYCILDREPLADALNDVLAGKSVDGHPVQLRHVAQPEDMRQCDVAYLGSAESGRLAVALAKLEGSKLLTVYEGGVPQHAGVVRFFLDGGKVRFEINMAAADREALHISSRMLSVASVVRD